MILEDKLYSSSEVAEILGVSLRSIYRYLEEGKLQADVKTATGRHRFSKKNINEFLYPGSEIPEEVFEKSEKKEAAKGLVKEQPVKKSVVSESAEEVEETSQPKPQVDWLAKFKAAQEARLKERAAQAPQVQDQPEPSKPVSKPADDEEPEVLDRKEEPVVPAPKSAVNSAEPISSPQPDSAAPAVDWLAKFKAAREELAKSQGSAGGSVPSGESFSLAPEAPVEEQKEEKETGFFYYTSGVKGLRELAHAINEAAKNNGLTYGFTLYAGMSLYKSIKPFSILHAYVQVKDKKAFEKALSLAPADKNSAQLCLISTEDKVVFETMKDMHGLRVASLVRLRKDLTEAGEDDLAAELDNL